MIGDTLATRDLSATIGDLPDATSHITTLTKVNQDNYGSEYRFRGTDYDYKVLVRNSLESPQANGDVFERHNVEFTLTARGDPEADPPTRDVRYITSSTVRFPKGGDSAIMMKVASHLSDLFFIAGGTSPKALKLLNFES